MVGRYSRDEQGLQAMNNLRHGSHILRGGGLDLLVYVTCQVTINRVTEIGLKIVKRGNRLAEVDSTARNNAETAALHKARCAESRKPRDTVGFIFRGGLVWNKLVFNLADLHPRRHIAGAEQGLGIEKCDQKIFLSFPFDYGFDGS